MDTVQCTDTFFMPGECFFWGGAFLKPLHIVFQKIYLVGNLWVDYIVEECYCTVLYLFDLPLYYTLLIL